MSNENDSEKDMSQPPKTVSLAEERVELGTRKVVDRRIRITRTTRADEKLIETELTHEDALIKRVAKNEAVKPGNIPQVRQEGEVTIIPVIEERIEIIKHYFLTEEIHVIKKRRKETHQENITLRSQEINISTEDE
ncbi:DUF2382 domain-containing protein [Enterobacter sp. R1(2018)]|uniref:DUF2382 domain-containing protein n=1 Tax=Enterobacter sp. R1(2018) TaxID=2447891 RepID=UPI000EB04075|nr:DUF2382 domain-containing protein [Enterobacter sp. R1(2018)]RKQ41619.1 DUF2382 domain-containing protein [Enterobacter sp. R1(2018)]